MYRQFDQEQDENEAREAQNNPNMYGQMPYDSTQQYDPQTMQWQGMQGMQGQVGGRPMICYPMMYGDQMGQYETQEDTDMFRQQGMGYYGRPNYPRPRSRRRRRRRPYFNIYPFFYPYYYPYYRDEADDDYDYED